MYPNFNAGIGRIMSNAMADVSTSSLGRIFIVCASTDTNFAEISAMYGAGYPDGTPIIFSTIALALAKTVSDRGDTILIANNHDETVITAGGITVSTNAVSIIGLGNGADRPTITFTTAVAASFNITGAEVLLKNIQFTCGIDAQTAMVNVTGTDAQFINCEFDTNSGTVGAILGILTGATSDRLAIMNCRFLGPAVNSGTTTTAQVQYESAVDIQIINNYFCGKMTQAILNVTGTVLRGIIANNFFVIGTGTKFISVAAASTPFITNNRANVASGTTPIVAAAGFVAGNIYSAAAGVTSTGQTGSTATVSTI